MIGSKSQSGFESMVNERKLMVAIVLLPYLKISELVKFCRLNKACYHIMQAIVKFRVLFENWGLHFTPSQAEAILLSASIALKVAAKSLKLKSIVKSLRIIGTDAVQNVKGTVNLLDMPTLAKMSLQELGNLAITQV